MKAKYSPIDSIIIEGAAQRRDQLENIKRRALERAREVAKAFAYEETKCAIFPNF